MLAAILALAAALRFWSLPLKGLWLDELITAMICLGRGPADLPVAVSLPFSRLVDLLTPAPGAGAREVVALLQDPLVQHTHPPLFHLMMNAWYRIAPPSPSSLVRDIRLVPAVLGVAGLLPMYGLLRASFRTRPDVARAGVIVMAVSPLMLLISQEARNYTLPTIFLLLALWVMTAILRRYLEGRGSGPGAWLAWTLLNAAGCYTHYYFVFAVGAQWITLASVFIGGSAVAGLPGRERPVREWLALCAGGVGVFLLFLPWLPTFISHLESPIQAWMRLSDPSGFLAQFAIGPVPMVFAPPGADLPVPILIGWTAVSVVFAIYVGVGAWRGVRRLWQEDAACRLPIMVFVVLLAASLTELFAISVAIQENLFIAPRYSYVWYPPVCALIAAGIRGLGRVPAEARPLGRIFDRRFFASAVVGAGVLGAAAINADQSFQKPFQANLVAANLDRRPAQLVIAGYANFHELLASVSYTLAWGERNPDARPAIVFVRRSDPGDYSHYRAERPEVIWESIAALKPVDVPVTGVWVIGPGLREDDFPARLPLRVTGEGRMACTLDAGEIFNSANNVRDDGGAWRSRRALTEPGNYEYAYYRCSAGVARAGS